jgi:hypothetical protein
MSTETDPFLPQIEEAVAELLSDIRSGKPQHTTEKIVNCAFQSLSAQQIDTPGGLPLRDLFRQIAFNSATIAVLSRKLVQAQDAAAELASIKKMFNLP